MSNAASSEDELLTTSQVRDLTGWPTSSINRWARAGDLPALKLPGRTGPYLFRRADISSHIRERQPAA